MYTPAAFEETRIEVLHQLIADYPLGTLVTLGPDGLVANHIPFLLDRRSGGAGTLIGHVARNNDVWRVRESQPEALIVFQSVDGYITPNWYASKRENHQVVPTWNYAVVHAYGQLLVHEDPKWLRGVVGRLTRHFEADQPTPWKMADAPPDYIASQLDQIVGIEIPISRLIGKWKTSQNRPAVDREGVVAGLLDRDQPGDATMADLVRTTLARS
jgi:transcriptional regulator